jgi:hypothetical protein
LRLTIEDLGGSLSFRSRQSQSAVVNLNRQSSISIGSRQSQSAVVNLENQQSQISNPQST